MKKNKIWWAACCLFAIYSCSDCMDDAEKISSGKIDKKENYLIGQEAYKRDRKIIDEYTKRILGTKLSFNDKVLPEIVSNQDAKDIKGFFFVNNNIVSLGFFSYCLQEKIVIELIIEKLNNDKLKTQFDAALEKFSKKITDEFNNLKGLRNQEIYARVPDMNKIFNDEVLKIILPSVIEVIENDANLNNKFEKEKLKGYLEKEYMFGIAHILLKILIPDHQKREEEIKKKWPDHKLFSK